MPSRNSKSLLLLGLLGVGVVGALGAYVKLGPGARIPINEHRADDSQPVHHSAPKVEVHTKRDSTSRTAEVFLPAFTKEDDLKFISKQVTAPAGEDVRIYAVNEFLKETKIAPPEAKLMSIDVHDGTAVLSFNKAFYSGYGTDDERVIVGGLQRVLGQFKDIEVLEFRNEGEKAESIGNIDLEGMKVER
jgi:hypothetical protein